jgi:flagellar basal-body rod protein FlgC
MSIDLIPGSKITSSALEAERVRMEIVANNMANVNSTGKNDTDVYQRRVAVFDSVFKDELGGSQVSDLDGVKLAEIAVENKQPTEKYAPYHPDANPETGMVKMPNISPIEEMLDMITAQRAYEANLSIMNQSKNMAQKTVDMFK